MRSPEDVRHRVARNEWDHPDHFRDQLLGIREGVTVPLDPDSRISSTADPVALRQFRESWEKTAMELAGVQPDAVRFEERTLRRFGQHRLPVELRLATLDAIAAFLGGRAPARLVEVHRRLGTFSERDKDLGRAAARFVERIEALSVPDAAMLAVCLSQLRPGMGAGTYLRSLPLEGVDTKLLERHAGTAYHIVNAWMQGAVAEAGGLESWLGCLTKDADRILVRPLCDHTRTALCGASKLWVTSDDLARMHLPGRSILIVENDTPGWELPPLPDTVAIAGTGNNLAWLQSIDLQNHAVGYWGDIDSWGLRLLSVARGYCPRLVPLLMDEATFDAHASAVVREPIPAPPAENLTESERKLLDRLLGAADGPARLEQEKLAREWTHPRLGAWASPRAQP